jgi:hypothetical protein
LEENKLDNKFKAIKEYQDYKKKFDEKILNLEIKISDKKDAIHNIEIDMTEYPLNDDFIDNLENQLKENRQQLDKLESRYKYLLDCKQKFYNLKEVDALLQSMKSEAYERGNILKNIVTEIVDKQLRPIIENKFVLIDKIEEIYAEIDLLIDNYNEYMPKNYKINPFEFKRHEYKEIEKNILINKQYEINKRISDRIDARAKRVDEANRKMIAQHEKRVKAAREQLKQNAIEREKARKGNKVPEIYKPQNQDENLVIKTGKK